MITLLLNPHHIPMSWGWSRVIPRGSWDILVAMVMMTQSSVFSTSIHNHDHCKHVHTTKRRLTLIGEALNPKTGSAFGSMLGSIDNKVSNPTKWIRRWSFFS